MIALAEETRLVGRVPVNQYPFEMKLVSAKGYYDASRYAKSFASRGEREVELSAARVSKKKTIYDFSPPLSRARDDGVYITATQFAPLPPPPPLVNNRLIIRV